MKGEGRGGKLEQGRRLAKAGPDHQKVMLDNALSVNQKQGMESVLVVLKNTGPACWEASTHYSTSCRV